MEISISFNPKTKIVSSFALMVHAKFCDDVMIKNGNTANLISTEFELQVKIH